MGVSNQQTEQQDMESASIHNSLVKTSAQSPNLQNIGPFTKEKKQINLHFRKTRILRKGFVYEEKMQMASRWRIV